MRSVEYNIYKLYTIKFAKWFMLYMPIIGLFYNSHGLSSLEIFTIQAAYSFTSAMFDIPSGYFADVVGRKITLVIGSSMGMLGFLLYSVGADFWTFLIAEVIMGIGQSFISGTDSAMLYDSLEFSKRKSKYLQYEGKITALGGFAETVAALLGGVIAAALSLGAVFVFQVGIAALALPAALTLVEPPRKKLQHTDFKQIVRITTFAMFTDKQLSRSILLSSVIGTATLCMAWTLQAFFVHVSFTEVQTTFWWVIFNLLVAVVSLYAASFIRIFGEKKLVLSMVVVVPLAYIIIGVFPLAIALAFLVVFHIVRGYATPILKDMIQSNCSADIRATVLSIRGLFIRLSFAVVGPLIGYVQGVYTFEFAIIGAGILFLIVGVIGVVGFMKVKRENNF